MKVAIIGSRNLTVSNISSYIPIETTEIVSGGAKGVDNCAREFARSNNMMYTEFRPDYGRYGKCAPLVRNKEIVEYSDCVLAFWNGESKGTKYVIEYARKIGVDIRIFILNKK